MTTQLVINVVRDLVTQAVEQARRDGLLHLETMPEVQVEHPGNPQHGDFATSLPLRLARATRINPLQLAEALVQHVPSSDEIERVVI